MAKPEIRFEELIRSTTETDQETVNIRNHNIGKKRVLILDDVEEYNNITYFTVNGQRFQTYGRTIQHEGCPMFDAAPTMVFAAMENEPESIERAELQNKQLDEELDLWWQYETEICISSMQELLYQLSLHGDTKKFIKDIKNHFDIMPNENTNKLLRKLGTKKS